MPGSTRTALLDAAQARFATEGFAGTSIRDLAAAVGIRESSVYKHFTSKQALLEALLSRAEERVAAVAAGLGVQVGHPDEAIADYAAISPERLAEVALGFFDFAVGDAEFVAIRRMLTLEQYRTPRAGDVLRGLMVERPLEFQAGLFAELMARGLFRAADPQAVALAFWGPVVALLGLAEDPDRVSGARAALMAHLAHFRAAHVEEER